MELDTQDNLTHDTQDDITHNITQEQAMAEWLSKAPLESPALLCVKYCLYT